VDKIGNVFQAMLTTGANSVTNVSGDDFSDIW